MDRSLVPPPVSLRPLARGVMRRRSTRSARVADRVSFLLTTPSILRIILVITRTAGSICDPSERSERGERV